MFRHLLVPTDGSELSNNAVKWAISLAGENKARITFFYAGPDVESSFYGEAALIRTVKPALFLKNMNRQAEEVLSGAQTAAEAAGLTSEMVTTISNEPYEAIIEAAKEYDCDLIVMASHGRNGVRGLLLGSQTQKVLNHSKIPVLVYR